MKTQYPTILLEVIKPCFMKLDAELQPVLENLRSDDHHKRKEAWDLTFKILWDRGLPVVKNGIRGPQYEQDREDLLMRTIEAFCEKILKEEIEKPDAE